MIGLRYLRGKSTMRGRAGVPISRTDLPSVYSPPPNVLHAHDHVAALSLATAGRSADGIYYSATDARLDEPVTDPAGHAHDDPGTLIRWRSLASWGCADYDTSPGSKGASYTADGTERKIAAGLVVVPPGATEIYARACATVEDSRVAALRVRCEIYGDGNLGQIVPISMEWTNPAVLTNSHLDRWRGSEGASLSLVGLSAERRIVVVWYAVVAAHSASPEAQIHALSVGLRGGA